MNTIITIGRQYGSGGREVGQKLAAHYGIGFYDSELLSKVAKESGFCQEIVQQQDERPTSSFLYNLVMDTYSCGFSNSTFTDMPISQKVFLAQFDTIRRLGDPGPCVIVGRCADSVLKDHADVINFFLTGDMADKKARILGRYDIEKDKAEDFIKKTDKRRASYYNYYTDQKWGSAPNFDLCLNTSKTGIEGAVKLMMDYIAIKEERSSD